MLTETLFIQRVRNSSLVRDLRQKMPGPKHITEAVNTFIGMVGAFYVREGVP